MSRPPVPATISRGHRRLADPGSADRGQEAQAKFASRVKELSSGKRELPHAYAPTRAIFGILLKNGKKLSPDTLFPFSQVTLAQTARELQTRYHITVEAVPVLAENASALSFKPQLVLAT